MFLKIYKLGYLDKLGFLPDRNCTFPLFRQLVKYDTEEYCILKFVICTKIKIVCTNTSVSKIYHNVRANNYMYFLCDSSSL